jgi:hypothetical protein
LIPNLHNGRLPLGRWPSDPDEVERTFASDPSNIRRRETWDHWLQLTAALRSVVRAVPAAWLSGSFLTDKVDPNDLDCVYLVESSDVAAAQSSDPQTAAFLQTVATGGVRSVFGLLIDSYILVWTPTAGVNPHGSAARYLSGRGYWDDLWSRERSTDSRESSIPRRGYLEVILDGYQ